MMKLQLFFCNRMMLKANALCLLLSIFSIACAGSPGSLSDVQKNDLCQRIRDVDTEAFFMAVRDLEESWPGKVKVDPSLKQKLEQLSVRKDEVIKSIEAGDEAAIKETSGILASMDRCLLSNPLLGEKDILVIKRYLDGKARDVMGGRLGLAPSNFQNNSEISNPAKGWRNEYAKLNVGNTQTKEDLLFKPEEGMIISDTELHWDGNRVMYSSIGTNNKWHLFELDLKKGEAKQVTPPEYADFDSFDGCYAPDGSYIFCSTATFLGLPCTNGGNKMCGLFSYDPKTGKSRQLTFDQDSNWNPVVMDDGKILYQRWEYADLPHSNSRLLFSMNPDGTGQLAFYGSNSYFPTAFFGARPIPGGNMVVGVAGGHHSVSRSGQLLVIDPAKGTREAEGVVAEIPYRGKKVEPEIRDRFPDGKWPQFLHPYPLNEKYFLVSMKRSPKSLWGVYLVDTFNNMTLIAEQEDCAYLEPVVLEKRKAPHMAPYRVKEGEKTGLVFLQDVYFGGGLKDVPKGTVKKLRIGSYVFSPWTQGGLLGTIGLDGPWDIKKVIGEVDVEQDGSASFVVPANTPIFVQPLDSEGKALQVMRSWFTVMPGESLSCIGCHENRNEAVETKPTLAARKAPQQIKPFYERERGFSFIHEIQPILNRSCISCHNGEKENIPYFKGDKMLSDWMSHIGGRGEQAYAGRFSESYYQLQRYVRRPGIESDMHMLVPMDVHADQTELFQVLNKGHHGVELTKEDREKLACWIDFNAPYHGRRSDIPRFDRAKKACELKAKYAPMFGVELKDNEWLPELKEPKETASLPDVSKTKVSSPLLSIGVPEVAGWPYYAKGSGYGAGHQLSLGYYRKTIDLGDGIKINMIKVPVGSFVMGSDRQADELPMHEQKVDKAFWIGQFEITNEQFSRFDKEHDSRTEHRHGYQFGRAGYDLNNPQQPVVRVSWREAMAFCEWLSKKTGLNITLPTESQWEWACRAGSGQAYSFGQEGADYSLFANMGDRRLAEYAACTSHKNYESARILDNPNRYDDWVPRDNHVDDGGFVSENVGRYRCNSWDIYDMHGNVWEWTLSSYKPYPYNDSDGRNSAKPDGEKRVVRGGSWYDRSFKGTSSYRLPYRDYQKVFNVGFRITINE